MKAQLKDLIIPLIITVLILIVLEILSTAFLPLLGLTKYTIPFSVLIVLFLGFKLDTPYLAIMILIMQFFHSFFSIEGWEMGTIAGVMVCLIISYVRDLIHFTSPPMTMMVTQIFQFIWFVVIATLIYMKQGTFDYVLIKFWRFLPESIVVSLMAPFFFSIFDKIWRVEDSGLLGDGA
jgi:hypothetical protein